MAALADRFGTALAYWVAGVLRWRKLAIAVSLLATALAAFYAAGHLGVNTDTANMISATLPWRRDFIEYRDAFPVRDRNLLIVIDAPTPARADAFSAALLAELRKRPDLYHSILLQGAWSAILAVSGKPRVGLASTPWGEELHAATIETLVGRATGGLVDDDDPTWRLAERIARLRDVAPDSVELAIDWLDALLRRVDDAGRHGPPRRAS